MVKRLIFTFFKHFFNLFFYFSFANSLEMTGKTMFSIT